MNMFVQTMMMMSLGPNSGNMMGGPPMMRGGYQGGAPYGQNQYRGGGGQRGDRGGNRGGNRGGQGGYYN